MRPDLDAGHFGGGRRHLDCAAMAPSAPRSHPFRPARAVLCATVLACVFAGPVVAANAIYRWVDADGVTHLSSERPPAGVTFERVSVASSVRRAHATPTAGSSKSTVRLAAASPEQAARRNAAILELQNRECVVALEAMDRMAQGGRAVEPAEFRRLQQTADQNCSRDPVTRREQEEQAARLRVAKGDACVQARNALADMLEPGRRPRREQLKSQQEFIEAHCKAPVR